MEMRKADHQKREGKSALTRQLAKSRASLAESLKAMDHSTYLLLSTQMFGTMLSRLRMAQQIGDQLQRILAEST
jgi:hypothetical protein